MGGRRGIWLPGLTHPCLAARRLHELVSPNSFTCCESRGRVLHCPCLCQVHWVPSLASSVIHHLVPSLCCQMFRLLSPRDRETVSSFTWVRPLPFHRTVASDHVTVISEPSPVGSRFEFFRHPDGVEVDDGVSGALRTRSTATAHVEGRSTMTQMRSFLALLVGTAAFAAAMLGYLSTQFTLLVFLALVFAIRIQK